MRGYFRNSEAYGNRAVLDLNRGLYEKVLFNCALPGERALSLAQLARRGGMEGPLVGERDGRPEAGLSSARVDVSDRRSRNSAVLKRSLEMLSISRCWIVAVVIGFTACFSLRASEPIADIQVNYRVRPRPYNKMVHTREIVQKTPNFVIRNGNATIVPSRAGFLYRIERAEGNLLLISMPSQGLLGWVPRDAVIPYHQAEGFFTRKLDLEPGSSFAHLMRAIVCQDNDRQDQAFEDLDGVDPTGSSLCFRAD